jgi:hypothetical protein
MNTHESNPLDETKNISPLVADLLSKTPQNREIPTDYFANFADRMLVQTKNLEPLPAPPKNIFIRTSYAFAACFLVVLGLGIWALRSDSSALTPAPNTAQLFADLEKEDIKTYLLETSDDLQTDWLAVLDIDHAIEDIYESDIDKMEDIDADFLLETLEEDDIF